MGIPRYREAIKEGVQSRFDNTPTMGDDPLQEGYFESERDTFPSEDVDRQSKTTGGRIYNALRNSNSPIESSTSGTILKSLSNNMRYKRNEFSFS